ncbi:MAG: prolipoprotein diacylglyceryl transferase [Rikenellaceae bacterium]
MMHLLYIDWNFDPTLISIFGFEIRYYSLMWVLAILIGAKYFELYCKREGLKPEVSESIFIYGTIGTMLGARVGHCLFYEPEVYLARPWAIITEIRDGGLASHGAAIGILIGLWLFARRNKLPYLWALDRIMIPTGVGGALVRLGNLFNSEIFGTETTLPWGFRFLRSREWINEYAPAACHPTQIYEAICYMITFGVVWVMYFRYDLARRRPGIMFGAGLIGIFLSRILIESIKNIQVGFEANMALNMGQWLSVPFVLMGIYMVYRGFSRPALEVAPIKIAKKK